MVEPIQPTKPQSGAMEIFKHQNTKLDEQYSFNGIKKLLDPLQSFEPSRQEPVVYYKIEKK